MDATVPDDDWLGYEETALEIDCTTTTTTDAARCHFEHAPDSKSVRHDSWASHCRHGDRCVYAHDKTYLPVLGRWTDSARLARLRRERKAAPPDLPARPAQAEHTLTEAL
ncbi:hypothetical protein C8Q76DRAFT_790567 [Earliella scabrosa]|nr:hypothetical protein C8Q76DRAFT_790567 [Earliella scabrosa]